MKRSIRFLCVLLLWVLFASWPLVSLFAADYAVRSHKVVEGESIRQLLLKNNCVTSMVEYATIRDAFANLNPGISNSALLLPGSTVSVPAFADGAGKTCLTLEEQRIMRVEFESLATFERVRIYLDGPVLPDVFTLKTALPVRQVCDFDAALPQEGLPRDIACEGRLVKRMRIGHEDKPFKRARVVLDVEEPLIGRIEQEFFEQQSLFTITLFDAASK